MRIVQFRQQRALQKKRVFYNIKASELYALLKKREGGLHGLELRHGPAQLPQAPAGRGGVRNTTESNSSRAVERLGKEKEGVVLKEVLGFWKVPAGLLCR